MHTGNRQPLPKGTRLQNGKFEVLEILGSPGGFGITYKGRHVQLNRVVAIKELFPIGCTRDVSGLVPPKSEEETVAKAREMFVREGRILAQLPKYAGLVQVLDAFEDSGMAYIVMEFIGGRSARELVESSGPMQPGKVKTIVIQIARALECVHAAKVLHRDVTPSNIIIADDGQACLVDFGLARPFVGSDVTHTTIGTPQYSAPEQDDPKGPLGAWTDVYGLGATATYLLTGTQPERWTARTQGDPLCPAVCGADPGLIAAINKATKPKPSDRFQSAKEFVEALQGSSGGQPRPKQPAPAVILPPRPKQPAPAVNLLDGWSFSLSEKDRGCRRYRRPLAAPWPMETAWMWAAIGGVAVVLLWLLWPK